MIRVLEVLSREFRFAAAALAGGLMLLAPAAAQKSEHYNSPLYAPKTYDPSVTTSNGLPPALKDVGIEQRLGEQVPLETSFLDETGAEVRLGSFFSKGRPVIVAPVYFECPMLCNQVLNGLTGSLKGISLQPGKDYDVVAISFDARENDKPGLAASKKASYVERMNTPGSAEGFHFLTGTQASIDAVMNSIGFSYKWDEASNQFAHAGGVMILTPEGKVSRYLYGIDYAPRDLKFGIMESADSKVGGVTEKLLLYCYHYDPSTGKYGLAVLRVMRIAGVATLVGMGAMVFVFWRRGKRKEDLNGDA